MSSSATSRWKASIAPKLEKQLSRLARKAPTRHAAVLAKIADICELGPHHYKNLRHDLKAWKRVHVDSSVLVFSVDEANKTIWFDDLQHHDTIYKR